MIKKDGKTIVIHNAIGIPKDNIKVDVEKDRNSDYLVISGEYKNEITNKIYSFDTRFGIVADEVAEIEWYVKDGLVYVEVSFKEVQKPQVNIKYRN